MMLAKSPNSLIKYYLVEFKIMLVSMPGTVWVARLYNLVEFKIMPVGYSVCPVRSPGGRVILPGKV